MRKYGFIIAAIAIVGFVVVLGAMSSVQAANPAPLMAPTPVSVGVRNTSSADVLSLVPTTMYTADGFSTGLNIQDSDIVDLQTIGDQTILALAANTSTLTLQFSNDGVNWVDGPAIATANAADSNDMQQYAIFGRLARVKVDVTNSNPVTFTVIAVAK